MTTPQPAPAIQVKRRDLLAAMEFAASAVERRPTVPYTTMLRGNANGVLTLDGSDFDVVARASIAYEGEHARFVMPTPRLVRSALIATGGETVSLAQSDPMPLAESEEFRSKLASRLAIVSGGVEATLVTEHPDTWQPDDAVAEPEWRASLSAADVAQIARVAGAISVEETRYYLNGVAVRKVGEWTWRFQATDGHRLKMVDIPLPDATGSIPDNTILPHQFIYLMLRHFQRAKEPLTLSYGPNVRRNQPDGTTLDLPVSGYRVAIQGQLGNVQASLTSKLIDGTYPDVDRVVPKEAVRWAKFDRRELLRAINAVGAFSNEKMRALRFTFQPSKPLMPGRVAIAIESAGFGHAGLTLDCENSVDDGQCVGFNGRYIEDCVKTFAGDEIVLSWANSVISSGAVLITDPADTAFRCVVMPMRV